MTGRAPDAPRRSGRGTADRAGKSGALGLTEKAPCAPPTSRARSAPETLGLEERLPRELEQEHVLWQVAQDVVDLLELVVPADRELVEDLGREDLARRQRHSRRPRLHVPVPAHPVRLRVGRCVEEEGPTARELRSKTGFFS